MSFWEKVSKDVQESLKEGLTVLKQKTGELTEEGKRKYKVFDLKHKVHKEMAELGALVYGLSGSGSNPMGDASVQSAIDHIKALEEQITEIEEQAARAKDSAADETSAASAPADTDTETPGDDDSTEDKPQQP